MSDAPKPTGYLEPLIEATDIPTKTIYELGAIDDGCCRWRIDQEFKGEKYGFCGAETLAGLSWCERHVPRVFENAPQVIVKAKEAAREKELEAV